MPKKGEKQMEREFPILKQLRLLGLFGKQIETLKNRGCPKEILTAFQGQKKLVLQKASEMIFPDGHLPFLPVIPLNPYNISDLLGMIESPGRTSLEPRRITDIIETPKEPYYIYDVDRESTRSQLPHMVKITLDRKKRLPLTAAELISFCIQSPVFSWRYGMWALSSKYLFCGVDFEPIVIDDFSGRPVLVYDNFYSADYALKCTPSCGGR